MTPTKLLIGQILIVFAIVLAGLWVSTQWIAAQLAYQSQLGAPWTIAFGHRVYHPWALFAWWYHFDAYAPHVFNKAGLLAGVSGFVGCAAAIGGSLWRARQAQHVTTYGSVRTPIKLQALPTAKTAPAWRLRPVGCDPCNGLQACTPALRGWMGR